MVTLWIVVRILASHVATPVQHVRMLQNVRHAQLDLNSVTISACSVKPINSSKEISAQTVGLIVFSVIRDQTNAISVRLTPIFDKMVHALARLASSWTLVYHVPHVTNLVQVVMI